MEDEEPRGLIAAIRSRSAVLIGIVFLFAWLAMIWFTFGDVL